MRKLLLIFILLNITMISAEEIINNPITIRLENNTIYFKSQYSINNANYTFNYTNITNGNYSYMGVIPIEYVFNNYFIYNGTFKLMDLDMTQKLLDCNIQNQHFNVSLVNCQNNLNEKTNISVMYTNCVATDREKALMIQDKDTKITTLQDNIDGNKNQTYMVGGICLILGVIGTLVLTGKLNTFIVDKQKAEFNMNRGG